MNLEDCRQFYAEEIRWCAGIQNARLVTAFARIPREHFLGLPPWKIATPEAGMTGGTGVRYMESSDPRDLSHNVLAALDASRNINNGQPSALGRWIDALDLKPDDRVFHLGSGTGYYTAILADTIGLQGSVVASEVDPHLAARAQENLRGYRNVDLRAADGAEVEAGECDAMLINAGVTHPHQRWLAALRDGGRLVLPLTATTPQMPEAGRGAMMKIIRKGTAFSAEIVTYVAIFSCTSVRDGEMSTDIGRALGSGAVAKIQSLRLDEHPKNDTCMVHGAGVCWSSAPVG